jgi:cobalt-zinc-cadmium efflux system outer membrane protein
MHRLTLAGLLPVLYAASVGAQSPSIVTEAEFLSVLDESHPAVVEAAEELAVAHAGVIAARAFENPALALAREDPTGGVEQTDVSISWQLPGAARSPEIAAREEASNAADARRSHRLVALHQAMREVYAEWALAAAREERLATQARRVEALAVREARRAERGEASGLEARRLALAATGLQVQADLSAAAADGGRARARSWYPGLSADAQPVLPPLPPPPELAGTHPLEIAAEADLAAATLELEAAGRFVRSPEISLGWQRQETDREAIDGPLLGLAWSVPVRNRNQAERAAAGARFSGAQARLERVRRELAATRAAAQATYARLSMALEGAQTALSDNERIIDGAEAAFRAGEASLTDLLDTQRSVTESALAVLDLHAAALAAHRELVRIAGSGTSPAEPLRSNPDPHPKERLQ